MIKIKVSELKKKPRAVRSEIEEDFEKNMDALRKKLIIRLISGILGTALILLFVFTAISVRSIDRMLTENFTSSLNESRDQRVERVEGYYHSLRSEMERGVRGASAEETPDFLSQNMDRYMRMGVEEVVLLDGSFNVLYESRPGDKINIKKEAKSLKFQNPFYVDNMDIEEDTAYQNLFYKYYKQGGIEHYLYFRLNNTYLNRLLTEAKYSADILNNEFYIISSNRELESNEYVINDISKKMLDGRVGNDSYNGRRYSYSFIDLGESTVYLQVYEDESVYKAPISRYKTRISLIWFIALISTICVIIFIRLSVESYATGSVRIGIEREADRRYTFLKKELVSIFDELDVIEDSLHKLDRFTENLDTIKQRIITQNEHSLKKIRDEEEILEKIQGDKDLQEKIKDKL